MTSTLSVGAAALILAGAAVAQAPATGTATVKSTPAKSSATHKSAATAAKGRNGPSGTKNNGFPVNGDGNGPTNAMLPKK